MRFNKKKIKRIAAKHLYRLSKRYKHLFPLTGDGSIDKVSIRKYEGKMAERLFRKYKSYPNQGR